MSAEKAKKILNAIDKVTKPLSNIGAIVLDDHRIGWLQRIPRDISDAIDAVKELFEEETS